MLLGLLSDTHDNEARARKGLELLENAGADVLLHAGDLTTGKLVPLFEGWRLWLVQGNIDRPNSIQQALTQADADASFARRHELAFDDVQVGLIHGDDTGRLQGMVDSGAFDLVVHGHTHQFRDDQLGRTRVVNPGALHRTSHPSVCTYDTGSGELERFHL